MHFSIPFTQELKDENGTQYSGFNIHANGVLHCVVRYSQLYDLHEQLKQEFGQDKLPEFPPKRFFAVKGTDLEERRLQLERYIQDLCQDQQLCACETFALFLSRAQQETQYEETVSASFEICLMNGSKVKINIQSTDKTDVILENAMATLGIDESLTYYFGLFLMKNETEGKYSIIRKLQEFECPHISLKSVQKNDLYKVVIRKSYWDQSYDEVVMEDDIGLNLLRVQAESEVKAGWISCSEEAKRRLSSLKSKGSKREYIRFCQTLKNYGYIQFNPCITNHPKKNSQVIVCIGNNELKLKILMDKEKVQQEVFQVTRIKSWKITSQDNKPKDQPVTSSDEQMLQLSFEYLISKGTMQWINIVSSQAIMMSMSIKSMVDELLRKRRGDRIKKPSDKSTDGTRPTFKPRDKTTEALFSATDVQIGDAETAGNVQKAKESVKKISDKFSNVSILSKQGHSADSNVTETAAGNRRAFEKIGEDDL